MDDSLFDLYDREKRLLAEGPAILERGSEDEIRAFAERLFERFARVVRENEDLTRHSDRQEQRLVKLNQNLKIQTHELDIRKTELENLSKQLAKYLPPQIHEALFAGNHDTRIATRRKKLTVFFSDIKGFTQTSENLQPEALTEYLNEYFSEMTQIALAHGATIDKYMGDAMMVFFGDPETRGVKEDARACVEMALRMLERLAELQQRSCATASRRLPLPETAGSWREVSIEVPLTRTTRYMVLHLAVDQNQPALAEGAVRFPHHYVDDVKISVLHRH